MDSRINIISLHRICENKQLLLESLQEWGLLLPENQHLCPNCHHPMRLISDSSRCDSWRWHCFNKISKNKQKKKACGKTREFRYGTIFSRSHLSIFQILSFIHMWVNNLTLRVIVEEIEISGQSAVTWASFCRELLLDTFMTGRQKLGGPNRTIEVYESRRRSGKDDECVFGCYEKGTGRVFMMAVKERDEDTLLPVLRDWIEPDSTIVSDCYRANERLSDSAYHQLMRMSRIKFQDPLPGAHASAMLSTLRYAQAMLLPMAPIKTHVPGNLARFLFYKRCAELGLCRTKEFFQLAGRACNPNNAQEGVDDDDKDMDAVDESLDEDNVDPYVNYPKNLEST